MPDANALTRELTEHILRTHGLLNPADRHHDPPAPQLHT
jgi:hypothetical protein